MVSCSDEGHFRNPYDCECFYHCYFNNEVERKEGNLSIGFYDCYGDLVFDETSQMSVLASTTAKCHNKAVPHEPINV